MKSTSKRVGAKGRLPDFLVIGAAKSGTTTFYDYLQQHPEVFLPAEKEPDFFSRDPVFQRGVDWYKAMFRKALTSQKCGEGSTTYSRWPHTPDVPKRISELLSNPKFIYLIRNPVDRTYSHYCHRMRLNVTMTFEEALKHDSMFVDCSLYAAQIDEYLRFFPEESFLFLLFDDLVTDPQSVMRKVEEFLGIEPVDAVGATRFHSNERHQEYISSKTTGRFRKLPGGSIIADAIPLRVKQRIHEFVRESKFGRKLLNNHVIPPMLPTTRMELVERFREPNRILGAQIRRDLSCWNQ